MLFQKTFYNHSLVNTYHNTKHHPLVRNWSSFLLDRHELFNLLAAGHHCLRKDK